MTQRESALSRKIRKAIEQHFGINKVFCFKVWGSEHMMAGLPDLIGCISGNFFGLEVKLPESRTNVSVRQEYVHSLIRLAGGLAIIVTSPTEAIQALEDLVNQS